MRIFTILTVVVIFSFVLCTCKNTSSNPDEITVVYQIACPVNINDSIVVVHDMLLKNDFIPVDTNFYLKSLNKKENSSISVKIERGMENNLYLYAGKLKGFTYVTMSNDDKKNIDGLIKDLHLQLAKTKSTKKDFINNEEKTIEQFLFKSFSLRPYDNFTVFTCTVQNIGEGIYIAIEVKFNFYNKYNTILETKHVLIKALVPKEEYSIKLILNVNQQIEHYEIASVIFNVATQP